LALSFRAAAFAAAICSRNAVDDAFVPPETARLEGVDGFGEAAASGANASPRAGRAFEGLAASVVLPVSGRRTALPFVRGSGVVRLFGDGDRTALPFDSGSTRDRLFGDGDLCGGNAFCNVGDFMLPKVVFTLRRLSVEGVKPKLRPFGNAGLALAGSCLAGEAGLTCLGTIDPSLVLGLLWLLCRLSADAGRAGGPMGDSTGEKKLDLRRSLGVEGMP
jgi:hypothetical protein